MRALREIIPFVGGDKPATFASVIVFLGLDGIDFECRLTEPPLSSSASRPGRSTRMTSQSGSLTTPRRPDALASRVGPSIYLGITA